MFAKLIFVLTASGIISALKSNFKSISEAERAVNLKSTRSPINDEVLHDFITKNCQESCGAIKDDR